MDEREIIRRCLNGDREAFALLVRAYQGQVLGLCYRMTGSREDAADIAQQAFLKAYHKLDTHDQAQPFRPWLLKIATHECISHLRRSGRSKTVADEEALSEAVAPEPDAPSLVELADSREEVRRAVSALPLPYRTVILQFYFEGLSYQQIADRSGLPMGTVSTHMYRAKQLLKRNLTQQEVTLAHAAR